MQEAWSQDNYSLGQCSITAFLAQDIFGGKVYGLLRPKEIITALIWWEIAYLT